MNRMWAGRPACRRKNSKSSQNCLKHAWYWAAAVVFWSLHEYSSSTAPVYRECRLPAIVPAKSLGMLDTCGTPVVAVQLVCGVASIASIAPVFRLEHTDVMDYRLGPLLRAARTLNSHVLGGVTLRMRLIPSSCRSPLFFA